MENRFDPKKYSRITRFIFSSNKKTDSDLASLFLD